MAGPSARRGVGEAGPILPPSVRHHRNSPTVFYGDQLEYLRFHVLSALSLANRSISFSTLLSASFILFLLEATSASPMPMLRDIVTTFTSADFPPTPVTPFK